MIISTQVWPNWSQLFSMKHWRGFSPSVLINFIRYELTEYCWRKYIYIFCSVPLKPFYSLDSMLNISKPNICWGKIHNPPPSSNCQYKHSFCPELMELMSLVQSRGIAKPGSYLWRAQINRFTRQELPWHLGFQGHKLHCRAHSKTPSQMHPNQSHQNTLISRCTELTDRPKISVGVILF